MCARWDPHLHAGWSRSPSGPPRQRRVSRWRAAYRSRTVGSGPVVTVSAFVRRSSAGSPTGHGSFVSGRHGYQFLYESLCLRYSII